MKRILPVLAAIFLVTALAAPTDALASQTATAGFTLTSNSGYGQIDLVYEKMNTLPDPGAFANDGSQICIREKQNATDLPGYGTTSYDVIVKVCAPTTTSAAWSGSFIVNTNGGTNLVTDTFPCDMSTGDPVSLSWSYVPNPNQPQNSEVFGSIVDPNSSGGFGCDWGVDYQGAGNNGFNVKTDSAVLSTQLTDAVHGSACDKFKINDVQIEGQGQSDGYFDIGSPDWSHTTDYTSQTGNPSVILLTPTAPYDFFVGGSVSDWQSTYWVEAPGAAC